METIDNIKSPTEWKKVFANNTTYKGLIYINSSYNIRKTKNPILKWVEDINRHFYNS